MTRDLHGYLGRAPAAFGERLRPEVAPRRLEWKGSRGVVAQGYGVEGESAKGGLIDLDVDGRAEQVEIHPKKGPLLLQVRKLEV